MRLTQGQLAPAFATTDLYDAAISSHDLKGKKVLLSFYRYASCPFCNLRFHSLSKKQQEWRDRGLELVAVFQSPTSSILEYAGKDYSPVRIIPNPDRDLYRLYGVESSWKGFLKGSMQLGTAAKAFKEGFLPGKVEGDMNMIPADFVIDEQGKILIAYYGKDISDHLEISEIEKVI